MGDVHSALVPGASGILEIASSLGIWHLGFRPHLCRELPQCHQRLGMREVTVIPSGGSVGEARPEDTQLCGFCGTSPRLGTPKPQACGRPGVPFGGCWASSELNFFLVAMGRQRF